MVNDAPMLTFAQAQYTITVRHLTASLAPRRHRSYDPQRAKNTVKLLICVSACPQTEEAERIAVDHVAKTHAAGANSTARQRAPRNARRPLTLTVPSQNFAHYWHLYRSSQPLPASGTPYTGLVHSP